MAQIKNINTVSSVEPEGVKFLVVKDGKVAHCDITSIVEKVKKFDPANINKSFGEVEKLIEMLTQKVETLEKRLGEVESASAQTSEVAEDAKAKTSSKKTTKKAE